ncbi:hypothetical protein E5K00_03720 [Hymenobacter aquaticus]|uniref:Uncharacterized protein n=1 Tax=Hymenobacter aquaticus TaxID=1867101 RepID=A0A4Z0Q414_9BACT|nr:hypothetical protein [Hymenobacter aquaticus]TGE24334.1 hypothetical protein E5K00_03720 [Hymenobacter aquaticus]
MSTGSDITADIPVGDLQLYDNYRPPMEAGNYFITVSHSLPGVATGGDVLRTRQEFLVAAPQFTIDTQQIINQYPAAGSTGQYGEVLPHLVLKDPMLAWERHMGGTNTPWLALLVFEEAELADGDDPHTKTHTATVADFLALAAPVLAPKPALEADVDPTSPCHYIRMAADVFQAVVPRLDELPYLSHVRKVNTDDRASLSLHEHGLFSVTAANRFPRAAGATASQPIKNIMHLVSLEGMEKYLAADADLKAYSGGVALVSLASWTFLCLPDQAQDFNSLATNLITQEITNGAVDPGRLWLRLPMPSTAPADVAGKEVQQRIAHGYSPLAYHTRSGEDTFAWYRGPLTPLLTQPQQLDAPFYTADAALIYDPAFGVFDVSLAAAWELGREVALADAHFAQRLLAFRRKAHRLTDALYRRLTSDHFTANQIDQLDATTTVQDTLLGLLTPQLVQDIGATADSSRLNATPPAATPTPAPDPIADTRAFLADPAVLTQLQELTAEELAPLAEWLAQLMLLYPVPFDNLVPDERILPVESLRFFYLDENWLRAALDGALSLGLDSSKQTFFTQVTKNLVYEAARQALAVVRDVLQGRQPGTAPQPPTIISGFLLRSALVTGWPNLAVRAKDKADTSLKILRLDHLATNVLFCLFDGVPHTVEFSEPQESLGFGVDEAGNAVLRTVAPGATNVGAQVGTVQIRDLHGQQPLGMRAPGSRVLHIAPTDAAGLVQTLAAALRKLGVKLPNDTLGPAAFALQLIKSAEAVVFTSQAS